PGPWAGPGEAPRARRAAHWRERPGERRRRIERSASQIDSQAELYLSGAESSLGGRGGMPEQRRLHVADVVRAVDVVEQVEGLDDELQVHPVDRDHLGEPEIDGPERVAATGIALDARRPVADVGVAIVVVA